jgi:hypothetical protein
LNALNPCPTTAFAASKWREVSVRLTAPPKERFDEILANMRAKGITVRTINHGSDEPYGDKPDDKTWIRSMYFRDPDGIAFEFASLMRKLGTEADLGPRVKNAKGERVDYTPVLLRQTRHAAE